MDSQNLGVTHSQSQPQRSARKRRRHGHEHGHDNCPSRPEISPNNTSSSNEGSTVTGSGMSAPNRVSYTMQAVVLVSTVISFPADDFSLRVTPRTKSFSCGYDQHKFYKYYSALCIRRCLTTSPSESVSATFISASNQHP
jgi:hypothetical protein